MSSDAPATSRRLFSVVTAAYDVERFLPDFLGGLDSQTLAHDLVEVVLVDDGSTDGTLAALRAWAESTDLAVTVLTQPNGGQSSARNLGMEHVTGAWVTFPDPDDIVGPDYLERVAAAIEAHPRAEVVGCPFLMLDDATGEVTDTHPLRYRFDRRARLRNADEQPSYFFVNPAAGFYRRERLEEQGLRFDLAVRPSFEDGHFGARYLLALPEPWVLFVPGAPYRYRKRSDGTSTLSGSTQDPRRYTDVFEHGYLDLLERAAAGGEVPRWLHHLVLYDMSWLLQSHTRAVAMTQPQLLAVADDFHAIMGRLTRLLDPTVKVRAAQPVMLQLWRDVLAHGWRDTAWHSDLVRLQRVDHEQGLVRVFYHYVGEPPEESFTVDGSPVEVAAGTHRPFTMMGRTLLHERVAWVPFGAELRAGLGGQPVPLRLVPLGETIEVATPQDLGRLRAVARPPTLGKDDPTRRMRRLARTGAVRRGFADAWVLMDRIHDADDSGERLFEHLREHRPDINAYFVVERGTHAWSSLRSRYGRRVVAHGSLRWQLLMHNALHLVSSHADAGVTRPSAIVPPGEAVPWRFTFLQHGVIKDDLSSWLNAKNIDVFVTSTQGEHDSIVGDDTAYLYTEREVALTGLPRFDRLRRLAEQTPPEERDLLLVCPTWRNWLAAPLESDSQRRVALDGFLESDFAQRWLAFVRSGALRSAAEAAGLQVTFLPHPNLQGHLDEITLPDHVRLLGFDGTDVQQVFARCALMVTDYSSMAFNAAYLDRPVVYYQFDRDRMFGGDHVGVGGYFDYERDGYGPVTLEHDETVRAVSDLAAGGSRSPEVYRERIAQAFPVRDGGCCERVVAAVEASARPWVARTRPTDGSAVRPA